MDVEEEPTTISLVVDVAVGYAGLLGVMVMDEIAMVNKKVSLGSS